MVPRQNQAEFEAVAGARGERLGAEEPAGQMPQSGTMTKKSQGGSCWLRWGLSRLSGCAPSHRHSKQGFGSAAPALKPSAQLKFLPSLG